MGLHDLDWLVRATLAILIFLIGLLVVALILALFPDDKDDHK